MRIREEVKGFPAAISRTERHSAVGVKGNVAALLDVSVKTARRYGDLGLIPRSDLAARGTRKLSRYRVGDVRAFVKSRRNGDSHAALDQATGTPPAPEGGLADAGVRPRARREQEAARPQDHRRARTPDILGDGLARRVGLVEGLVGRRVPAPGTAEEEVDLRACLGRRAA